MSDSDDDTIIPDEENIIIDDNDDASTIVPDDEFEMISNDIVEDEVIQQNDDKVISNEVFEETKAEKAEVTKIILEKLEETNDNKIIWNMATFSVPELSNQEIADKRWRIFATKPILQDLYISTKSFLPLPLRKKPISLSSSSPMIEDLTGEFTTPMRENTQFEIKDSVQSPVVSRKIFNPDQEKHDPECSCLFFPSKCSCTDITFVRVVCEDIIDLSEADTLSAIASLSKPSELWSDSLEGPIGGGKWLLFLKREQIDQAWTVLVNLLKANKLGNEIKIFLRPDPEASTRPGYTTLCVYTSSNTLEIARVLYILRTCGLPCTSNELLAWKADETTSAGIYADKNVDKTSDSQQPFTVSTFISEKLDGNSHITKLDRCNYTKHFLRVTIADINLNAPISSIVLLNPPQDPRHKTSKTGKWLKWAEPTQDEDHQPRKKAKKS